jgi:hypothetical protein
MEQRLAMALSFGKSFKEAGFISFGRSHVKYIFTDNAKYIVP